MRLKEKKKTFACVGDCGEFSGWCESENKVWGEQVLHGRRSKQEQQQPRCDFSHL